MFWYDVINFTLFLVFSALPSPILYLLLVPLLETTSTNPIPFLTLLSTGDQTGW